MAKILISITSHQTIPNVLFIKEVKGVDKYIFIYTPQMEAQLNNIIKAADIAVQSEMILVDAYSLNDIKTNLVKYQFKDTDEYIINVTGGTKIMSLGVYQYFSQLPNVKMYYFPDNDNTFYQEVYPNIGQQKSLDYRVGVIEYLTSYGIEVLNPNNITPKSKDITRRYFEFYKSKNKWQHNEAINELFQYMSGQRGGIITNKIQKFIDFIDFQPAQFGQLMDNEIHYLTANWFEDFTYYSVKHNLNLEDRFIKRGIEINLTKTATLNELDIVFIHKNTCHLIECKLGLKGGLGDSEIKDFFEKTAYKLGALKDQFGLTVKPYLFTLEGRLRQNGNLKSVYQKRAAQQDITILDRQIILSNNKLKQFFLNF
jgi:hypothetical protein